MTGYGGKDGKTKGFRRPGRGRGCAHVESFLYRQAKAGILGEILRDLVQKTIKQSSDSIGISVRM